MEILLFYFVLAIFIGLIFVYTMAPAPRIIIKYKGFANKNSKCYDLK
jgi:hypothetical protein